MEQSSKRNIRDLGMWTIGSLLFVALTIATSLAMSLPFKQKRQLTTASTTSAINEIAEDVEDQSWPELKVVIASPYSSVGTQFKRDLLDYIGKRLQRRITLSTRKRYAETMRLMSTHAADVGIIDSGSWTILNEKTEALLVAAPIQANYTTPQHRAYIIVPAESPAENFSDLADKHFAMTDPLSSTGAIYPIFLTTQQGRAPEQFFSTVSYTYSNDKSITAVADGLVDGASIDGLVWEYLKVQNPDLIKKTRVIERSPWFGSPPIAVPSNTDPELFRALRNILVSMNQDPEGAKILKRMAIRRFAIPDAGAYGSIRQMITELQKKNVRLE